MVIKDIDLSAMNMEEQSQLMVQFGALTLNSETLLKYLVPPHLMGLLVGKQKITMGRTARQTCTEIEQASWSDGEGAAAIRVIGFIIWGATDIISEAVDEMICTVKEMEMSKAVRLDTSNQQRTLKCTNLRTPSHQR